MEKSEDDEDISNTSSELNTPLLKPLVVIEPHKKWVPLDLQGLWNYRELLFFLTWRDVKIRYKQTLLGATWAILQPVCMMLIFTLFFGRVVGLQAGSEVPYPLFVLAGLVPWTFFANSVTNGGNSLVSSAGLITKVYFPRLLLPLATALAGCVDLLLAFLVLFAVMLYYGVMPGMGLVFLPLLIILTFLFASSVGMWMSALNVKYRDVRFALPFIIQLWLFVSSVIVPVAVLPQKWRWLLLLNPMASIIEGYRAALFGQPFDWTSLLVATIITFLALVFSAYSFRHAERQFADII